MLVTKKWVKNLKSERLDIHKYHYENNSNYCSSSPVLPYFQDVSCYDFSGHTVFNSSS